MKIITKILLALLFTLIMPSGVYAQTTVSKEDSAFETVFKDYQKQIEEYQVAHQDYVLRRSQYLRFKTLQSQQDARNATAKMLQERDDVVIFYIRSLKERLNEASGVSDVKKAALNTRIDAEMGWFTDHKGRIPTAGTLDDLVRDNKTSNERFSKLQSLVSEILSVITSGKITDFDQRLTDLFNQVKTKIGDIKADSRPEYQLSGEQLQNLDRWIFNSDNLVLRIEDKQAEADNLIMTFVTQQNKWPSIYSTVLARLSEAQQFLKEEGGYLTEIVREIKTKS